jgi:hypothetical protein
MKPEGAKGSDQSSGDSADGAKHTGGTFAKYSISGRPKVAGINCILESMNCYARTSENDRARQGSRGRCYGDVRRAIAWGV